MFSKKFDKTIKKHTCEKVLIGKNETIFPHLLSSFHKIKIFFSKMETGQPGPNGQHAV
jgi:hypothetical protein